MWHKLFLLFCLYLPFQIAFNPTSGVDLASARVFIIVLFLLWLFSGLKNCCLFIPAKKQTAAFLIFIFLTFVSLFWADNTDWGMRKFLFLLSISPIYFVAAGAVRYTESESLDSKNTKTRFSFQKSRYEEEKKSIEILKFIVWGAALVSFVGIVQFSLQFFLGIENVVNFWRGYLIPLFLGKEFSQAVSEYPSWLVAIGSRDYLRSFATFPDPHMFSFYLGLVWPFSVAFYFYKREKNFFSKQKIQDRPTFYLFLSFCTIFANLLTFSRGGYIGMIAGLFFAFALYLASGKLSTKKVIIFLLAIFVSLSFIAVTPIGGRMKNSFSFEEGSNKIRLENWIQAISVIKNEPLGVGIGNYAHTIEPGADYRKPIYAHNLFLDIAAEMGILSALIFVLMLFFSIRSFLKNSNVSFFPKKKKSENLNWMCLAGAISLTNFSFHAFFDTPLYSAHVLPLLLIIIALSTKSSNHGLNEKYATFN